jgi:sugar O-acyltransferase (sialic acid O-acetyltransferase NeuD family)
MGSIVVIGGGGHAKVVISVLKKCRYEILGYTDKRDRGAILGVPYLGDDGTLRGLARDRGCCEAAVGLGKTDESSVRVRLQEEIATIGFAFPLIVSPLAVVNEEVELGPGTAVFDSVVVNSGTVTGRLCILNTSSTVEHDCRLGDNVHIAPGAILSGGVTVGANSMIGAGSIIIQDVTVCAGCLVGAGSTVVESIRVAGTYVGNPAKRIG